MNAFDPAVADKSVYSLKIKFSGARDGFHALCQATHPERNIMLSHYVACVKRADANINSKQAKQTFISGGAKKNLALLYSKSTETV